MIMRLFQGMILRKLRSLAQHIAPHQKMTTYSSGQYLTNNPTSFTKASEISGTTTRQ